MSEVNKKDHGHKLRLAPIHASKLINQGKQREEIEKILMEEDGLTEDEASRVFAIAVYRQESPDASEYNGEALTNMAIGAVICIIGIVVTVSTYQSAANSPTGGSYVIAWGAILFGGYRFIVGLMDL